MIVYVITLWKQLWNPEGSCDEKAGCKMVLLLLYTDDGILWGYFWILTYLAETAFKVWCNAMTEEALDITLVVAAGGFWHRIIVRNF